jgi:hypothetical protein
MPPQAAQYLDAWLEPYRRAWQNSLDALARHLDRVNEKEES